MGGIISYFFGESSPTDVTDLQQTEDSSPIASSSPNPEEETSDLPHTPCENTPRDTPEAESIIQTTTASDHTEDVDNINIYVMHAGKIQEIMIFPLERISSLHQQACNQVHKKPETMKLIFEGEELDLKKTVKEYPKLRRGTKVSLIRAF